MLSVTVYDNKHQPAGQENMSAIMAEVIGFVTGTYNIRDSEIVFHRDFR